MVTRQQGNSNAVLRFLQQKRGIELHVDDIAAATGISHQQVISAVNNLRKTTNIPAPRRGWYVYQGPKGVNGEHAVTLKAKAEVHAILTDDRVLLVIEGNLYVASPLEV